MHADGLGDTSTRGQAFGEYQTTSWLAAFLVLLLTDNISLSARRRETRQLSIIRRRGWGRCRRKCCWRHCIKLIDFGRTQKLKHLKKVYSDDYVGDKDMKCLGMRLEEPWGVDFDFFGLCASSYLLLRRDHMKCSAVECGESERGKRLRTRLCDGVDKVELWKLRMPSIDRHVNEVELWKYVFDKLLHFDPVRDDYDSVVGGIRNKLDAYVCENHDKVEAGLGKIHSALPEK